MEKTFKTHYRNRYPHITPLGGTFFVTFRLADSLPRSMIKSLSKEYEREIRRIQDLFPEHYKWKCYQEKKRLFGNFDRQLDKSPFGACHLGKPAVAEIVRSKLHQLDSQWYFLLAFCIMPNHVHLLIDTSLGKGETSPEKEPVPLCKIMHRIKGSTAYAINRHLKRKGTFWQKDSYDHLVRNRLENSRIRDYILQNPVKAGLVKDWKDYRFTYASPVPAPSGARGQADSSA